MRSLIAASLATALTLGAGAASAEDTLPDGTRVGTPVSYANLTLVPLLAAAPDGQDYLVLDEGMDGGQVKVIERADESVNELVVENRARKPLFLMSGEVILGGKQDRIIGKDTVIPPGQRLEVPVFCVEHGRWAGKDRHFRSAKAMAHTKLRKKASFGDQGEVWKEVSAKNKVRATENGTDTYRRVATERKVADAVRPYAERLEPGTAGAAVVGVAVALNGKLVALEQFDSPRLFAKLKAKLLRSYYVEAIDAPTLAGAKAVTAGDVVVFAAKERETDAETVLEEGSSKTMRVVGKGLKGSRVLDAEKANPAKPVYKSLHVE